MSPWRFIRSLCAVLKMRKCVRMMKEDFRRMQEARKTLGGVYVGQSATGSGESTSGSPREE